jgi:hypothetical protein
MGNLVHLVQQLMDVQFNDNNNLFVWNLTTSGIFYFRSVYLDYMNNGNTFYLCKYIWKMKVSWKIKIFMWFLHRKVTLKKRHSCKKVIYMVI